MDGEEKNRQAKRETVDMNAFKTAIAHRQECRHGR